MALQKCRSIFFTQDVRIGRAQVVSTGQSPTRISLVDDKRYTIEVDEGIVAVITDTQFFTKIRVSWNIVRDYELAEDSAKADQAIKDRNAAQSAPVKPEKTKAPVLA